MSGARAWREATKESEKGRVETAPVKRYRPGQVPEWMQRGEEEDASLLGGSFAETSLGGRRRGMSTACTQCS